MESGTVPWRQPWSGGSGLHLPRRATGQAYQGINVVMLWLAALERGYSSVGWRTYRQSLERGGQVRKGEKSATVVKFGRIHKEGSADPVTGATSAIGATESVGEDQYIPWARAYTV